MSHDNREEMEIGKNMDDKIMQKCVEYYKNP